MCGERARLELPVRTPKERLRFEHKLEGARVSCGGRYNRCEPPFPLSLSLHLCPRAQRRRKLVYHYSTLAKMISTRAMQLTPHVKWH